MARPGVPHPGVPWPGVGGMVNAGVSENCSLIRRVGRDTAGGLHSCAEAAPAPTLGDGSSPAPPWTEPGVRAEGGGAEGGGTGWGPGRGSAVGIPGGRRGDGLGGPPAHPSPPHMATGRLCSGGCPCPERVCVFMRACLWGPAPIPSHPLRVGTEASQRGRGRGLTTEAPGGRRAPRLTRRLPRPPCSRRPWISAGFLGSSAPPVCSALGRKRGPGLGPLGYVLSYPVLSAPLGAVCPHGRSFSSRALFR